MIVLSYLRVQTIIFLMIVLHIHASDSVLFISSFFFLFSISQISLVCHELGIGK